MRRTQLSPRKVRTSYFVLRTSYLNHRRGISLLEVLISMFVLLVGLVSVASLIPVGRFELGEGLKVDRSSTLGQAAFHDIKIRGMLSPNSWANNEGPSNNLTAVFQAATSSRSIRLRSGSYYVEPTDRPLAFAFDPVGVAAGFDWVFPVATNRGTSPRLLDLPQPYPSPNVIPTGIPRLTFGPGLSPAAHRSLTVEGFQNHDELVFTRPSSGEALPLQRYSTDSSNNPIKRQSEGNYSWMFTLVPDPNQSASQTTYTVSMPIFYKRDLSTQGAGERVLRVGAISGGDVQLQAFSPSSITPEKQLDVRPGQWLMLAGWMTGTPAPRYYKWYRIVSAESIDPGSTTRNVTLAGGDWPCGQIRTYAWVFDGVVAVYEKQMKLEAP